jgi:hypothetical protein
MTGYSTGFLLVGGGGVGRGGGGRKAGLTSTPVFRCWAEKQVALMLIKLLYFAILTGIVGTMSTTIASLHQNFRKWCHKVFYVHCTEFFSHRVRFLLTTVQTCVQKLFTCLWSKQQCKTLSSPFGLSVFLWDLGGGRLYYELGC